MLLLIFFPGAKMSMDTEDEAFYENTHTHTHTHTQKQTNKKNGTPEIGTFSAITFKV